MPQGLQVWNSSGVLEVDISSRLGILLGSISTGTSDGSISPAGFSRGTPFFFSNAESFGSIGSITARISVSATTLSWTFSDGPSGASRIPSKIFYGVY